MLLQIVVPATLAEVKQRFRFVVIVGAGGALGLTRARFRNVSELSAEIARSEIFHGGSPIPFKMPGRVTYTDVTMEFGATKDGALFAWFMQAVLATQGGGGFAFKRPVSIAEKERLGRDLNRWHLAAAWPTRFVAGEWDNESDEFTISSVTLTYDFFAPTALQNTPTQEAISKVADRL